MSVSAKSFAEHATRPLDRLVAELDAPTREAADLITGQLRAGGVIQAFGTGHRRPQRWRSPGEQMG
jgi:uncharacterized phosphosugar-binding protein